MSEDHQSEQDALVEEIHAAFANVSRDGGVSWSETEVLDLCGDEQARRAARARGRDHSWMELVDDSDWPGAVRVGGFSFLDPVGMRYCLPAAMIRVIRRGWPGDLAHHLTLPPNPSNRHHNLRRGNHRLEQWSALDDRQRRCIAKFIRFMIARDEAAAPDESEWREPYESYWHLFP